MSAKYSVQSHLRESYHGANRSFPSGFSLLDHSSALSRFEIPPELVGSLSQSKGVPTGMENYDPAAFLSIGIAQAQGSVTV